MQSATQLRTNKFVGRPANCARRSLASALRSACHLACLCALLKTIGRTPLVQRVLPTRYIRWGGRSAKRHAMGRWGAGGAAGGSSIQALTAAARFSRMAASYFARKAVSASHRLRWRSFHVRNGLATSAAGREHFIDSDLQFQSLIASALASLIIVLSSSCRRPAGGGVGRGRHSWPPPLRFFCHWRVSAFLWKKGNGSSNFQYLFP